MSRLLSKLTYANVVATLALCLAVGGGAAFAAGKIGSNQIADGGVHTKNLQQRSVTSGKLAIGAVRSNQIAARSVGSDQLATGAVRAAQIGDGAVGADQLAKGAVGSAQLAGKAVGSGQLADGAVGSAQIGNGAVGPAQMQFPVTPVASASGGSQTVEFAAAPYPLTGASWTQHAGSIALLVGTFTAEVSAATLNQCDVLIEFGLGENFADGELGAATVTNFSHSESQVLTGAVPALPILADATGTTELSARVREQGGCNVPSTIKSTALRVVELG